MADNKKEEPKFAGFLRFLAANWKKAAKNVWWLLSIAAGAVYILCNLARFTSGTTIGTFDTMVLAFTVLLALLPFISEIDILGVQVKKEIGNVKSDLDQTKLDFEKKLMDLRFSIRNINENNNEVSQTIVLGSPSPQPVLDNLSNEINRLHVEPARVETNDLPENAKYCFEMRYRLEQELVRICYSISNDSDQFRNIAQMANFLKKRRLIDELIERSLVELARICNAAVHGVESSTSQIRFVKETAPKMIAELQKIKADSGGQHNG